MIVMDVVMPRMGGLDATRRIMERLPTPIVLVSANYNGGEARQSFEAMEAGALSLVTKPSGPQADTFTAEAAHLTTTVKLMAEVKLVRRRVLSPRDAPWVAGSPHNSAAPPRRLVEIVALAASTGGPAALATLLAALPKTTPVPIVVVQHITAGFHQSLVDWLDRISPLSVRLARHGHPLEPGEVLIAPNDTHMRVTESGMVALDDDPEIGGHRPSATYLFQSVARTYGVASVGVILTGMGDDGVAGLRDLSAAGGLAVAQDEATSVVYGMPRMAAELGIVDRVFRSIRWLGH